MQLAMIVYGGREKSNEVKHRSTRDVEIKQIYEAGEYPG